MLLIGQADHVDKAEALVRGVPQRPPQSTRSLQLYLDPAGGYGPRPPNTLSVPLVIRAVSGSVSSLSLQLHVPNFLGMRASVVWYAMQLLNLPLVRRTESILWVPHPDHPLPWLMNVLAEVVVAVEG